MKTNKQFIDEIYSKYEEHSKEKQQKKQFQYRKIANVAAIVVVLFASLIVFSEKPMLLQEQSMQENSAIVRDEIQLQTIGSFENFYEIMKIKNTKQYRQINDLDSTLEESLKSNTLKDTANSKTNTQVENVDEADVVKLNDKYMYYVTGKKIIIIDTQKAEEANKITEINYENDKFNPQEIYITNNKLIVIGNEHENGYGSDLYKTRCIDIAISPKVKTGIILYDITKITEPKEIRRVMIEGYYVSSRMIENNIYFVANKYMYTSDIIKREIEELNQEDYKPKYEDTAISSEIQSINYNRIYCLEETEDSSYLIIAGLNIESNEEADIKTFLGAGQYIYSSENNMYIAINKQQYGEGYQLLGGTTHILKLGLENGKITFKAETEVDGQINNQFSMDENGEDFRIATTTGNLWNIDENTSNNIYVLNAELKEKGKITGFGKEEKIYSVRYVGDKAYVVTFKQTDPLFVIDLSNPENPQILGELKLPGYSTYLHPYDEKHIIGFGYETKQNGETITTNGLKMVMFDISDLENPQVLFKVNIGDRYTSSELLYNHKALLYSKENNMIGFTLKKYEKGKINSKAIIYDIDLLNGFILKGEMTHITNDYNEEIERVVLANNHYYTLSTKMIKVFNKDTFEIKKEINLK